jgi:peptidyl-prolyl cis-trans isomerase A (cyclophilin A)
MKKTLISIVLSLIAWVSFSQKPIQCLIKTSLGDIKIEINAALAPKTAANFLNYVDNKLYDGTSFFRVCTPENEKDRKVRIEVIQGGEVPESKQFKPIPIETTKLTAIKHLNGTISMARDTPNSATSSFFICINDQPELDFEGKRNPDGQGFAAFGEVSQGMEVVRKIQQQKEHNQRLIEPVIIYSIRRLE